MLQGFTIADYQHNIYGNDDNKQYLNNNYNTRNFDVTTEKSLNYKNDFNLNEILDKLSKKKIKVSYLKKNNMLSKVDFTLSDKESIKSFLNLEIKKLIKNLFVIDLHIDKYMIHNNQEQQKPLPNYLYYVVYTVYDILNNLNERCIAILTSKNNFFELQFSQIESFINK